MENPPATTSNPPPTTLTPASGPNTSPAQGGTTEPPRTPPTAERTTIYITGPSPSSSSRSSSTSSYTWRYEQPTTGYWNKGPSRGTIAGAVVGSIAGLVLLVSIGVWMWKRRRARAQQGPWPGVRDGAAIDNDPESIYAEHAGRPPEQMVQPFHSDSETVTARSPRSPSSPSSPLSMSHPTTAGLVSAKFAHLAQRHSSSGSKANGSGAVAATDDPNANRAVDAGGVAPPSGQLPPAYDPAWEAARRQSGVDNGRDGE